MLLIIENFYEDPDFYRDLALGLDYTRHAPRLPAARSTKSVLPSEAVRAFSSYLKVKITPKNGHPFNGTFQLRFSSDFKDSYVHADLFSDWAGIVYLSKRTRPRGGTSFFEHKLTGLKRFPRPLEIQAVALKMGLQPQEIVKLFGKDRQDGSKWREIDRVGYVYNRFVAYDAQLFHQNGRTWGSSIETGRLTHNFFISSKLGLNRAAMSTVGRPAS